MKRRQVSTRPALPYALGAALSVALLLRLILAACTQGYPYDLSCFFSWGEHLLDVGPRAFYSPDYFADYPPGYLWILGLTALLRRALHLPYGGAAARVLLAIFPAVCDCAIALLLYSAGQRWLPEKPRLVLCVTLFTAFNPMFLYATGVWGQVDSAFLLPLLFCFYLLEQKRYLPAAFFYGLSLAVKPQALFAGPVLAVCFLVAIADAVAQGARRVMAAVGRIFLGAALALAPVIALSLPFFGVSGLWEGLLEKYLGTGGSYPYASVNAFNWLGALGGNWQALDSASSVFGVRWRTLGFANLAVLTVMLVWLAVRLYRRGCFSALVLAAFYTVGVFTLAPCMHERYLLPGVAFTLFAALSVGSRKFFAVGFGLSFAGFLNLAAVCTTVESSDPWFFDETNALFLLVIGLLVTALFVCLTILVLSRKATKIGEAYPEAIPAEEEPTTPRQYLPTPLQATIRYAQPRWHVKEIVALGLLTAATAVFSFAYLGDTKAPQNGADANDGTYVTTVELLPGKTAPAELWVYPGISIYNNGLLTVTDPRGAEVARLELDVGAPFLWQKLDIRSAGAGPYTVTITNGQVMELCFRDDEGGKCPLGPTTVIYSDPLFDEQTLVPETISQLNGFYFDEIYHARTGYEQLHKMPVYETTHPPLGKDLIMLGIAIFGMTGFGWRFSGTLFGVLMVPLMWCFARRLTRRRWLGAAAGCLLALDFMRYAQSRLATIDVYATFFILLGAYCMVWYCQSVLQKGVADSLLPMALGGVAFGLGCAAKWTGIYAGAGLAVLYFGVLWARYRQNQPHFRREVLFALAGGVLFYILTPLCIYLASYLPYVWRDPGFSLGDWWAAQISMFRYHATLEATHPYESRWYTWLFGLRPVWYYSNGNLPTGLRGTIAGLGGPVIWLAGLVSIVVLFWRQVSGRQSTEGGSVLVLYLAQLVPWMLVPRCTFLYHYFPSSLFCLAALIVVLSKMRSEKRAKQVGVGLCAVSLLLLALYYPALSGLPVSERWINALRILPSFGF